MPLALRWPYDKKVHFTTKTNPFAIKSSDKLQFTFIGIPNTATGGKKETLLYRRKASGIGKGWTSANAGKQCKGAQHMLMRTATHDVLRYRQPAAAAKASRKTGLFASTLHFVLTTLYAKK